MGEPLARPASRQLRLSYGRAAALSGRAAGSSRLATNEAFVRASRWLVPPRDKSGFRPGEPVARPASRQMRLSSGRAAGSSQLATNQAFVWASRWLVPTRDKSGFRTGEPLARPDLATNEAFVWASRWLVPPRDKSGFVRASRWLVPQSRQMPGHSYVSILALPPGQDWRMIVVGELARPKSRQIRLANNVSHDNSDPRQIRQAYGRAVQGSSRLRLVTISLRTVRAAGSSRPATIASAWRWGRAAGSSARFSWSEIAVSSLAAPGRIGDDVVTNSGPSSVSWRAM